MIKKRLLSCLLVLLLCMSALPLGVLAEGETPYIEGITFSGGVWTGDRTYFHVVTKQLEEDESFLPYIAGELISSPYQGWYDEENPDWRQPVVFYFEPAQETYRMTLYSWMDLDETALRVVQDGETLPPAFTEYAVGAEDAHLYRAEVSFALGANEQDAKPVTVYCGDTVLALLSPVALPDRITAPYIGEILVDTERADGSLTVELSGVNLPAKSDWTIRTELWDSETDTTSYPIRYAAVSEETDALGVHRLVMELVEPYEEGECWFPVFLGEEQAAFYGNSGEFVTIPMLRPFFGTLACDHVWGDWAMTALPTCTEAGEEARTCSVCGETETRTIEKLSVQSGWQKVGQSWYYYDASGDPVTGWQKIDGKWYWFERSGVMAAGWKAISGKWYWLGSSGAMATGWVKINGTWYWFEDSGAMAVGWRWITGRWYWFENSGAMATGWVNINRTWYYFDGSGAMYTGWLDQNGTWYFLKPSGAMAASEWYGGYWFGSSGAWTYQPRGSWKQNSVGWWFGDTSGWYAKSTTIRINDNWYTFDAEGYWME